MNRKTYKITAANSNKKMSIQTKAIHITCKVNFKQLTKRGENYLDLAANAYLCLISKGFLSLL